MQIHQIKRRNENKKSVQVGRGGKRGKTSGRGGKGQTARAGNKRRPALRDVIKKLPKRRGYGKNRSHTVNTRLDAHVTVSLTKINEAFKKGETVSTLTIIEKGIAKRASGKLPRIKVVSGTLDKALVFERVLATKSAAEAIKAAGGTI